MRYLCCSCAPMFAREWCRDESRSVVPLVIPFLSPLSVCSSSHGLVLRKFKFECRQYRRREMRVDCDCWSKLETLSKRRFPINNTNTSTFLSPNSQKIFNFFSRSRLTVSLARRRAFSTFSYSLITSRSVGESRHKKFSFFATFFKFTILKLITREQSFVCSVCKILSSNNCVSVCKYFREKTSLVCNWKSYDVIVKIFV